MVLKTSFIELNKIVKATHSDPHHVLGMHEVQINGKKAIVVRAFVPLSKSITLIDPKKPDYAVELEKIHEDGFYQVIIPKRTKFFKYKLLIVFDNDTILETYDAYSFEPTIFAMDLHLFGEGNHYKIYEKLGAIPTNIDGVDGVSFGVWAPNAVRVSVIGDFNCWDGRRNPMRVLGDSGIWEIFIPNLKNNDKYKFEIRSLNNDVFEKSDPYGNFFELRPSSSCLVFDISTYEWNDRKWIESNQKKDKLNQPINIYEVQLGSWKKHETEDRFLSYTELADKLIPYVKKMGYTHIELMPIEEYPFDGSWGYQVTGYYAPTSRYGNPHEFMHLIDKCHQNNIGVILDWVPAHFPKDSFALANFDGTALYEHPDPNKGSHPQWGTLIFNYGRNEVKNFLIANALFWIEQYHIDGLRVDAVTSMIYLNFGREDADKITNDYGGEFNIEAVEFIKHLNSIVAKTHPEVLMIAEESTSIEKVSRPVEEGGLGFDLKWNMGWMNDFLSYIKLDPLFRKGSHNNLTFGIMYATTENFILVLSHDEVVHGKLSLINKQPGDLWQKCAGLRLSLAYAISYPGKNLLFMGGEFGQFIEWDENKQLDWFLLEIEHHAQIQTFVKDLNHLYVSEKAFWYDDFRGTGFEWINCKDSERSLLTFIRKAETEEDTLIIACNFTPNPIEDYRIGVPYKGKYKELINSDNPKYGGSGVINTKMINSKAISCDDKEFSIDLRLPPLGISILKYKG